MNRKTDKEKIASEAQILRNWLDSIPRSGYNAVISKLVERCMIPKTTYQNWRYGRCRIPEAGKRDINSLTKEISGIEIFKLAFPVKASGGASGSANGEAI